MDDENIEVAPSEESGNVPAEMPETTEETPSEQPIEETPAESGESESTAEPTEELFELPDGRKVTADVVAQEYKNLMSDYTKKSQTLAELEKGTTTNQTSEKPYENPDWQPTSYKEVIELAKQEALQEIEQKQQTQIEARKALEDSVSSQLAEIKKTDPTLNENALFLHANEQFSKYGVSFPNLESAYKHMKDTSDLAKKVQKTTADNIAKRNDPVSVSPGATGARPDPSAFANATEYLRSLQG